MNVHLDHSEVPVHRSLVSLLVLTSISFPASGQRLAVIWVAPTPSFARSPASIRQEVTDSSRHDGARVVGGVLGGTAGFFAGGFAGEAMAEGSGRSCEDLCGVGGFIIGAMIGESFGMVGGMALAGPGTRAPDLLASVGMAAVGAGVAGLTHEPLVLVAVPIVQLVALVVLDHSRAQGPAPD